MDVDRPRLLLINKFYHDVGPAGGVGRYVVQEEEDLAAAGWDVIPFAMADEHARPSRWDRYFVRARDYSTPRWSPGDALSLLWNREAAARLEELIRTARPDVAHIHNIYHHLSPSILPVLARHHIPIVMTLHDLRLLCPAIHMLRRGEVCERCRGGRFHHAVLGRCVKNSRAASLLAAVETAHQRWRGIYTRHVNTFLCPSRFYRDKYAAWGFPAAKLQHLPNFVDLDFWHPDRLPDVERDAYVYFGRISQEKGLRTLLDAQALWEQGHIDGTEARPPLCLLIAGDGPCLGNTRARVAQLGLETVEVLGPLDIEGLREVLGRARFSVIPSEWYENAPMAALESLAADREIVGSDLGGLPELIEPGVTGELATAGDPQSLFAALLRAGDKQEGAARRYAEAHCDRAAHMVRLEGILRGLLPA
ncbi:MAG: glycosyltransferase family 4 protein [bacterium]|nr:glycosyltransferase family 4 protein [bacterium]